MFSVDGGSNSFFLFGLWGWTREMEPRMTTFTDFIWCTYLHYRTLYSMCTLKVHFRCSFNLSHSGHWSQEKKCCVAADLFFFFHSISLLFYFIFLNPQIINWLLFLHIFSLSIMYNCYCNSCKLHMPCPVKYSVDLPECVFKIYTGSSRANTADGTQAFLYLILVIF